MTLVSRAASQNGTGQAAVEAEDGEAIPMDDPKACTQLRLGGIDQNMSLSVAPEDVPLTQELLRAHGVSAEFDADGCPKIESAAQHRKIAQALGLFSGRDGYGHQSVSGRHENSGARRGRDLAEGRARVDRLRRELEAMPEDAELSRVEEVVRRHS